MRAILFLLVLSFHFELSANSKETDIKTHQIGTRETVKLIPPTPLTLPKEPSLLPNVGSEK